MAESGRRTALRICPLCEACCGLELSVDGERVERVRGDEADVFSHGYLCPKGVALGELHHDPDRLTRPLVRRDGELRPASWDEAYAEVARLLGGVLARHGRAATGVYLGNPVVHKASLSLYGPAFVRALGTPHVYSASTLDQMPKQLVAGLLYGSPFSIPVPDLERTDLLVVFGANPAVSNGSLWTVPDVRSRLRALRRRGGRLVVLDPRRTETAALADQHHFVRPGSDAFVLLGLAATLVEEGLVRPGALAAHVVGLETVMAAVREFPPERVAPATGLDAATLRGLARTLAAAPRAAVYGRLGTCTQPFGTLASWLVEVLNVFLGQLDREGGAMFPCAAAAVPAAPAAGAPRRAFVTGRRRSRVSGAPEVLGELPATCLAEEIDTPGDGQLRALFVIGGNPVLSVPNGPRLARAFGGLEAMVSLDLYLNETSRHAHVILPATSPLEESHFDLAFPQFAYRNAARYSPAVLPRPAGLPAEWQTLLRLAAIVRGAPADADVAALDEAHYAQALERAGPAAAAGDAAPTRWRGPERLIDLALRRGPYGEAGLSLERLLAAPHGIDLGPLAPRLPGVLATPSGRIELAPPAVLAELARAAGALGEPAPALVLIGRRQVASNNSWLHNLPSLARGRERCTLLVHPTDARRLSLDDGGQAEVSASGRALLATVEVSDEVMPGVVSLPHGWGHDLPGTRQLVAAARPGGNFNALLDDAARDPLSGNAVLSGVAVEVRPA